MSVKGVVELEYAIVRRDYGQGKEMLMLPVAKRRTLLDSRKASSVYDVLIKGYGEDPGLVLGNYLRLEKRMVQEAGILRDAQSLRLISYAYKLTESCIQQPPEETVVDLIFRCVIEGVSSLDGSDGSGGSGSLRGVGSAAGTADKTSEQRTGNGESLDGSGKIAVEDFRVRYILDMRPCEQKCIGPLVFPCRMQEKSLPIHRGWPVKNYLIKSNDYLMPIIYKEDYERLAHEIIQCYFPNDPEKMDAEELARRMGLKIRDVRFQNPDVMGQLYYNFDNAELLDDAGNPIQEQVRPGTILISKDNCSTPALRNSTIAHECSHMYLDRWYFLLQIMGGAKPAYTSRKKSVNAAVTTYRKKSQEEWMELHCEKMPAYFLMERDSTKKYITEQLGERRDPVSVRRTINSMAARFKVSRSMARYRMVELGFREAEGVFCYVNGVSIPDHGCSASWPEGVTYTVPIQELMNLSEHDELLAKALLGGRYMYVEGHVCKNDRKYICYDRQGIFYLTPYARIHMDECCLAFRVQGRYREGTYQPNYAARNKSREVTDHYCSRYSLEASPEDVAYVKENTAFYDDSMLWGDYLFDMSDDYREAILDIMKKKGITQEKLSFVLGVDRKVVYNFLNAQEPSIEHLVGVCVALKLPYFVSTKLIQNAGSNLRRSELHHLYRQFLMQADRLSVERCNDILKQKKYQPLFNGKNE